MPGESNAASMTLSERIAQELRSAGELLDAAGDSVE
jgi:hypothetical protein